MQRARQQRQFATTPASSSSGLARAAIGSARGVLSRVILVTALLVLGEDVQVRVLLGLPRAQRIRLHKVLPGCRLLPPVADAPTAPSACRGAAKPGVRLRSGAQRFSPVQPHSPARGLPRELASSACLALPLAEPVAGHCLTAAVRAGCCWSPALRARPTPRARVQAPKRGGLLRCSSRPLALACRAPGAGVAASVRWLASHAAPCTPA